MNIFTELKKAKENYNTPIHITDGLTFSLKEKIKIITYYSNSKFLNHQENEGYNFFNIVNLGVDIFKKAVDLDTKNFLLFTENPNFQAQVLIESKELQKVFKEIKFPDTINNIVHKTGKYGAVITKRSWEDEKIKITTPDFNNLIISQIDLFDAAIIEKHELTYLEIEAKRDIWNNIDEVLELFTKDKNTITVYEMEGEFPKSFLNENVKIGRSLQHHFLVCDDKEIVLYSEELKESNYKIHKMGGDSEGRVIGIGQVEKGIQAQEAVNRYKMYELDLMAEAATSLYKTTDDNIENLNVLKNLKHGDVIKSDISKVNTTSPVVTTASSLTEPWEAQLRKSSFTNDAYTGESLPSGTAFRSVAAQINQTATNFDYEKERMGLFLGSIIEDWLLPEIHSKINRKHLLSAGFTSEELKLINEEFLKFESNDFLVSKLIKNKDDFSKNDYLAYEKVKSVDHKDKSFLDLPRGFFKGYKKNVHVITTGEQQEKQTQLQSYQSILDTVGQNPAILQDKVLFGIFEKMLALVGHNPVSLGFLKPEESKKTAQIPGQESKSLSQFATTQQAENIINK